MPAIIDAKKGIFGVYNREKMGLKVFVVWIKALCSFEGWDRYVKAFVVGAVAYLSALDVGFYKEMAQVVLPLVVVLVILDLVSGILGRTKGREVQSWGLYRSILKLTLYLLLILLVVLIGEWARSKFASGLLGGVVGLIVMTELKSIAENLAKWGLDIKGVFRQWLGRRGDGDKDVEDGG
jgi:phage-related holin